MAAEEKKETVAEEPKGGKSFVKIIIIVLVILILLAVLGVGGLIAWKKYIAPAIGMAPHEGGAVAKKEKEESGTTLGPMLPLEPFIVNLAEPGGKRFIKVTMEIELGSKELDVEFKNKLPQFKDHIITVLSSKTMDEVITAEGKFKLKEDIMARINQNLKTGVVKNIFFTEFVVQ
ncbi:MAG: flagellar basal body-associated FliL family protein [Nitrospinae bacterium]|nr:flagellar basal body-associated FliL family protein [Nitrospinota bacterium]MBI5747498.1 flagellar basal body-associated FliL family protein [Nitrospinota bacterium]